MKQEQILNQFANHIWKGDCSLCRKMKWNKDCPWDKIEETDEEKREKYMDENFDLLEKSCNNLLLTKLSENITVSENKIEATTNEGEKFLSEFFTNLDNFDLR